MEKNNCAAAQLPASRWTGNIICLGQPDKNSGNKSPLRLGAHSFQFFTYIFTIPDRSKSRKSRIVKKVFFVFHIKCTDMLPYSGLYH